MGSLAGTRLVYIVAGGRAFEPIKDAARPAEMHLQRRDFVTGATTGSERRWRSSREWISTAASHARSGTERPRPIKLPSARPLSASSPDGQSSPGLLSRPERRGDRLVNPAPVPPFPSARSLPSGPTDTKFTCSTDGTR